MIANKTWREIRVMALVYLLILELLLVPVIVLWPDFYGDLQRSTMLRNIGVDFVKRIMEGVSGNDEQIAYLNWMAVHLFFKGANLVGLAAAVLLGTSLFARERESHTLEFLLARPISRTQILWQKSWPTVLCIVVGLFLANWSAILWSRQIDLVLPFWPLTLCCIQASLFVLLFLAFTTWVSVLCRVQAHVAFWVGGLTVVQIGFYLVPRFRHYSIFRLSDFDVYGPILAGNLELHQLFDPFQHQGQGTLALIGILLFYGLALRSLRRLEL
ncbi:MAG: ABC transporter permease subunit [Planctomycetota bacterium]|nr:ABC transporter permease subunit [Planctomycetota bacterium]